MRSFLNFITFLLLSAGAVQGQTSLVKGTITDEKGTTIAFASIYQKGTTKGTSANGDGEYQLRLPNGKAGLVFKAVGYTQETKEIELNGDITVNAVLKTEVYQLKDVVIAAGGEDPAYAIIRNAIRKRKSNMADPKSYSCNVYIKGLQKMLAAPKKFFGQNMDDFGKEMGLDSNRRGILYLSESESKYTVEQPNKEHEEMISSKVSGSTRSFSWNRASELDVNFYENLQDWEGLTNRPLISPIADNALAYYKYKFLGTSFENGVMINKIQVIPKRKAEPVFGGNIYIMEDSWKIYSAELMLTKDANLNFVDTIQVKQQFFPVKGDLWMPATVRFDFVGGFFGFRFGGNYTAVYRDYEIDPSLPKKLFSELIKVTKDVNKKDSTYWNNARPVPLTDEEQTDYKKKSILATKRESKEYLDSLDKKNNTFKPKQVLFGSGYTYRNRFKKESVSFGSALQSLFYNTVEGVGLDYTISYRKQIDSARNRYLFLSAKARYGFSSEKFLPSITGTIPLNTLPITFSAGSDMLDLSNLGTQSQSGNTINSLLFERNRLKLYRKDFASLGVSKRFGAIAFNVTTEWSNREWMPNTADFKIRDVKNREFTSNNPFVPATDIPLFPDNQSFRLNLRATYEFSKKYVTYPTGRYYVTSKYPLLAVNYTKGIKGILGSDVAYDLLAATLSKADIPVGLYGRFTFFVGAGKFLTNDQLYYPDFKHFAGNQSTRYRPRINGFLYLPIYDPSTAEEYFQLNTEHNFSGFFMDKLPLIKKLKLRELAGFNYLSNPGYKSYKEYYFGLQYLAFKAYYGFAYRGSTRVDKGIRLVIGL